MNYLNSITVQALIFFKLKKDFPLFHFKSNEIDYLIDDLKRYEIGKNFLFEGIKESFINDLFEIKKDSHFLYSEETAKKFNLFYDKILKEDDNIILSFEDVMLLKNKFLVTYPLIGRFDILKLIADRRESLLNFIDDYIEKFSKDNLTSEKNYYSINRSIEQVCKQLEDHYNNYGPRFNIDNKLIGNDRIRLFELLLYFKEKGLIEIKDCDFRKHGDNVFNINVDMKKSPQEIQDIYGYWEYYGDLRVNEKAGVAFYKKNRYPFKSITTKSFKLLCYFIKNSGKEILIDDLYDYLHPDDKDMIGEDGKKKKEKTPYKNRKQTIKDLIKDIEKNLGITEEKSPLVKFMIIRNKAILISNPPENI